MFDLEWPAGNHRTMLLQADLEDLEDGIHLKVRLGFYKNLQYRSRSP